MTNFAIGRREAYEYTRSDLSLQLLEVFDRLIAWPSATPGHPGYRDEDLTGPGYCTWQEVGLLYLLAKHGQFQRPIEIGSAAGWSAVHLLHGLSEGVKLTCVDPFTETARGLGSFNVDAYEKFRYHLTKAGLWDRVDLAVRESPECLSYLAPEDGWDFAFVDGWHFDGQPRRDLEGLLPYLAPGALVVYHDFHYPDVAAAASWLAEQGWFLTRFATPNQMFALWQGESKDAPTWWENCLRNFNKLMQYSSGVIPLTSLESMPNPVQKTHKHRAPVAKQKAVRE